MLNEGWDVLNLFDIVRLYETRQSGGKKISPYTIKEAQLIGRGARYCPFIAEVDQNRFTRKYDHDLNNPNRILETLFYHSMQNSRYITELRQALKETGLLPNNPIEIEYILKEDFKSTGFFKTGLVFSNKKREKSREEIKQIDHKIRGGVFLIAFRGRNTQLLGLFDDTVSIHNTESVHFQKKLKDVPLNILYGVLESFDGLKFNTLKSHFPHLKSNKEFLTSDDYLGNITLQIESFIDDISGSDWMMELKNVFRVVSDYVGKIQVDHEGTREFYEQLIRNVIRDKKIYIDNPDGDGVGVSQSNVSKDLAIDLLSKDWYVFQDNFGTTEEKAFVKYFSGIVPELRKTYDEVYLVRNERFAEFAIFEFETGERFEPDFLLFLRKKKEDGFRQEQIYIEPKGTHLLLNDKWKEDFLTRIESKGIPTKKYVDDNEYCIFGLPFFNQDERMEEFKYALKRFES